MPAGLQPVLTARSLVRLCFGRSCGVVHPGDFASREFVAYTAVRALGYRTFGDADLECEDSSELSHPKEDKLAVDEGIMKLESGYFSPYESVTEDEAERIIDKINEIEKKMKLQKQRHLLIIRTMSAYSSAAIRR